jgi:hypothetical protein
MVRAAKRRSARFAALWPSVCVAIAHRDRARWKPDIPDLTLAAQKNSLPTRARVSSSTQPHRRRPHGRIANYLIGAAPGEECDRSSPLLARIRTLVRRFSRFLFLCIRYRERALHRRLCRIHDLPRSDQLIDSPAPRR